MAVFFARVKILQNNELVQYQTNHGGSYKHLIRSI